MFFIYFIIVVVFGFILHAGISWLLAPVLIARGHRNDISKFIKYANHESFYKEPLAKGELRCFPSVFDKASKTISLVVPAYNEEFRIPKMLDESLEFMEKWAAEKGNEQFTYEIIVVDDGSQDQTCKVVYEFVEKVGTEKLRLVSMGSNQGKGAAIRKGMLSCRGEYALMVDADGATDIKDAKRLLERIKAKEVCKSIGTWQFEGKFGAAIGSRAHMEEDSVAKRQLYRTILMYGFHFFVWLLCSRNIKDTQCGFKLFTRDTVRVLFPNMRLERWAFDTELVILAEKLGIPLEEVAVTWQEVPGSKLIQSKLDVITTSLSMLRDMLIVRLCYVVGIWKIQDPGAIVIEKDRRSSPLIQRKDF